ncbi:MAG TPA: GerMN domain-containing protein [Pyrinomonadaceae bacterium]
MTRSLQSFAALALLLVCTAGEAQTATPARLREVKIYLVNSEAEYDAKNPFGLQAVARKVDARRPLRAALAALVAGPTAAEEERGLGSSTYGIRFISVKLKRGVAHAHFALPNDRGFPGDLAPAIFKQAVTKTATQFPNVRRTVICLDGDLNFDDESGAPPKECPKV